MPSRTGVRISAWTFFACSLLLSILLVHYAWRSAPVLRRLFVFVGSHLPFRSVAGRYRSAGQFLTTLSHLVAAGLSLPTAMRRAVGAAGSAKLEKGVLRTADAIEGGESPNDAWCHSGLPRFAVATVVATTRSAPARLVDGLRRAGAECRERYVTKRERFFDMLHPIGVVVFGTMLAINMHKVLVISDYWAEANRLW